MDYTTLLIRLKAHTYLDSIQARYTRPRYRLSLVQSWPTTGGTISKNQSALHASESWGAQPG